MTDMPDDVVPIDVSYRAWATKKGDKPWVGDVKPPRPVTSALVFDTETTIDAQQDLIFGFYRWVTYTPTGITTTSEGVLYADDLPRTDPEAFEVLKEYVSSRTADVDSVTSDGVMSDRRLHLISRAEFVEDHLFLALRGSVPIVGFNLPFDISRLAVHAGAATGRNFGGFSLRLWAKDDKKYPWRPSIIVKHLDSKKSFITATKPPRGMEGKRWDSTIEANGRTVSKTVERFIDLRTLTFALSNNGYTLAGACREWGVDAKDTVQAYGAVTPEFIDYARQDVKITAQLLGKTLDHFYSLNLSTLEPNKAYSPASIGKASLRGMGIPSPLERQPDFPREILGAAMQAFYGGRAEVMIRRTHLPVAVHDFTSMYPSVNTLMRLWDFLTCERIDTYDDTANVQAFLDMVTIDDLYNPETWPKLTVIVTLKPQGDVLPVRGKYSGSGTANIGVNPVWSDTSTCYTLADVVASKLLTGQTPIIERAVRLAPHGAYPTLKPALLADVLVDPSAVDFFRTVIETRKRQADPDGLTANFLKTVANSTSYGIFSEFNTEEHPDSHAATYMELNIGLSANVVEVPVRRPEAPGRYCFPPLAALITGAAKLMLAMFEHEVTTRGGSWVFCDTDSLAAVATPDGGLIPCVGGSYRDADGVECVKALSHNELDMIRRRFDEELNPYDRALVGSLVKFEVKKSGVCFAVSAKRYVTYRIDTDGSIVIVDGKEHGLGHVTDPRADAEKGFKAATRRTKWTDTLWREVLQRDLDGSHRDELWDDRAALRQVSVSSPNVLRRFKSFNHGKPWSEQIKPFNFVVTTSATGPGWAIRESVLAPYDRDPLRVRGYGWMRKDGTVLTTVKLESERDGEHWMYCGDPDVHTAYLQDMRRVVDTHAQSLEVKFRDPTGRAISALTAGHLRRTPTLVGARTFIGKEANDLEAQSHLLVDQSEAMTDYATDTLLSRALPILAERFTAGTLAYELRNRAGHRLAQHRTDHDRVIVDIKYSYRGVKGGKAAAAKQIAAYEAEVDDYRSLIVTERAMRYVLSGKKVPKDYLARELVAIAVSLAQVDLASLGVVLPERGMLTEGHDASAVLALWGARTRRSAQARCVCGCGQPRAPRSRYAVRACATRAHRAAVRAVQAV